MLWDAKNLHGSFNHQEHRIFSILPSWASPAVLYWFWSLSVHSCSCPVSIWFERKPSLQRHSAESSTIYPVVPGKGENPAILKLTDGAVPIQTLALRVGYQWQKSSRQRKYKKSRKVIWSKVIGNLEAEWKGEKKAYSLMACSLQSTVKILLTLIAHDQASLV